MGRLAHPRRPRARASLAVGVALGAAGALAWAQGEVPIPGHAAGCLRVGEAEVELTQPAPGDTLDLPHRHVDRAHFELTQDSLVFRLGKDYLLDAPAGRLLWIGPEPQREPPLIARYRFLALELASEWRGPGRVVAGPADPGQVAQPGVGPKSPDTGGRTLPAGARLEVGGSKTVSLEFGNRQDVNLTQSLDLTIRGQLAERVEVSAVLTDRNLPLQPEGTTAELADLDKVLISVTSPWGALDLGDLTVQQSELAFLAHRRELQGVRARGGPLGGPVAGAALGRGTGRYETAEFLGQDGRQGPYQLVRSRPGEEALMIAGSERVWLDGRRLERGEDADYTVDYSDGEIFFTTRNPIHAHSEVRVEYQMRQGVFDRGYYALDAAAGDSAAHIATAWVHESDDPGGSPTLELNDAERAILRAAGDSVTAGMEGGVRQVGLGRGPYELVESDTLDAPIFVFLGKDTSGAYLGSYEVTFVQVEAEEGDYRDSTLAAGDTIFVYAGREKGDFLPGRRLYLPEQRDVVGAKAGARLGGGLEIAGEGAFSWLDRNVLSSRDDGDNGGGALTLNGTWRLDPLLGTRGDRLRLHGRYRGVSERFAAPEALDPAFYYRRWNAPAGLLDGRDQRGAVGLTARPGLGAHLLAEWEGLDSPRDFEGSRWHLRAERGGRLRALAETYLGRSRERGSAGSERQWNARLGWHGRVEAEGSFEAEDQRRGTGEARSGRGQETYALRMSTARLWPWGRLSTLSRLRRDHQNTPQGRRASGRVRLDQIEAEIEGDGGLAHVLLSRTTTRDAAGHMLNRADLADWVASHKAGGRLFAGEWRGNLTTEQVRLLAEKLVFVGLGGGHYDSTGRYVGLGDYEVFYAESDSANLETRLDTALRMSGRPVAALAGDSSRLAAVDVALYGRVRLRTPESVSDLIARPGDIVAGDAPATKHDGTARGELAWQGAERAPAPRLVVEYNRSTQRGATGFVRRRSTLAHQLETRWSATPGLQTRLNLGRERERAATGEETGDDVSNQDERRRTYAGIEATWRFLAPLSARLGSQLARDEFRPEGQRREEIKAWVGSVADFGRRGRLELSAERLWVGGTGNTGTAGGFVVERPGWRIGVNGSVRPWDIVVTTLALRVDRREGRQTVVTGTMEARAFF